MPADRPTIPGSWAKRRRLMWTVTVFCMACVGWVLFKDLSSNPAETAVSMSFFTLSSVVASYVFGAAYDDSKAREHDRECKKRPGRREDED